MNVWALLLVFLAVLVIQAEGSKRKKTMPKSRGLMKNGFKKRVQKEKEIERDPALKRDEDEYSLSRFQGAINDVKRIVQEKFKERASVRSIRWITKLEREWDAQELEERKARAKALDTVKKNIIALGDGADDSNKAIKGVLSLVEGAASLAGPLGELVSVGAMFVSSFLSMFGHTKKPKPMAVIVREQINAALEEFLEEVISNEAEAAVMAFRSAKGYVDALGQDNDKIPDDDVDALASNVPAREGISIMSKLFNFIEDMIEDNRPKDARKCFRYLELYLRLATLRKMILMQVVSLIPETRNITAQGYIGSMNVILDETEYMLNFLHDLSLQSKLMPYFDGDRYFQTAAYLKIELNLERPNPFPGLHCIDPDDTYSFGWVKQDGLNPPMLHPIATITPKRCSWKIIAHGNDQFSIVNKYDCPNDAWCDSLLSIDPRPGKKTIVGLEKEDPVIWAILKNPRSQEDKYFIVSSILCGENCRKFLNFETERFRVLNAASTNRDQEVPFIVGVLDTQPKYTFKIYKAPEHDVTSSNTTKSTSKARPGDTDWVTSEALKRDLLGVN
ncbi:uncharacterized protein LOC116297242 [Actinia tenebrosa]|uniref:Uncharacterized protein LOC116297242 n=1 Tax=Actinia tenebrosa TaxID=6105 RepID=A0A6P8I0N8_ACTTE|nr:uncharacterized protein LOC116297242 [Actinia tenebrosa]